MASGNIKTDYSVMQETSNLILNRASLIDDLFSRLKSEYDSLNPSYWQSDSATLFSERIASLAANFEPIVNEFYAAGYSLNTMVSNYEEVDTIAMSSVESLYTIIDKSTGKIVGGNSSIGSYKSAGGSGAGKRTNDEIPNSSIGSYKSAGSSGAGKRTNDDVPNSSIGSYKSADGGGADRRTNDDVPNSSIGSYKSVNKKWQQIKDGGSTEI